MAERWRRAENDEQRTRLRLQLAEVLGLAFDQRRELQQRQIELLETRLQELREQDRRRGERKDEIVQRRLAELTGQPDGLAWDIGPLAGPSGNAGPAYASPRSVLPRDTPPSDRRPPGHDPFASQGQPPRQPADRVPQRQPGAGGNEPFGANEPIPDDRDGTGLKIIAPAKGLYLGAYNWKENHRKPGVKEFEEAIGSKVALTSGGVCVSGEGQRFAVDASCLKRLYERGYVVLIDVVPRGHSPQQIIDGEADTLLAEVADAIKSADVPVMLAYPREPELQPRIGFDGGGYGPRGDQLRDEVDDPYSAYGCTAGDDPMCLDGPQRYRDMCRHMHDVIEMHAPGTATWVAGAAVTSWPGNQAGAQHYELFYPGDAYVDWHAINVYPAWAGDSDDLQTSRTWSEVVDPIWTEINRTSPDKPVIITEFGIHAQAGARDTWFNDFFAEVKTNPKYSNLKAFVYWQMGKDAFDNSNCRIRTTDPEAKTWAREISTYRDFYLSNVMTSGGVVVAGSGGGL